MTVATADAATPAQIVSELEETVSRGDSKGLDAFLGEHWLELLEAAPAELIVEAIGRVQGQSPATDLLAAAGSLVIGGSSPEARRETLLDLAHSTRREARLAVAAALLAALDEPATIEAREAALCARRVLLAGEQLPALDALIARIEGRKTSVTDPMASARSIAERLCATLPRTAPVPPGIRLAAVDGAPAGRASVYRARVEASGSEADSSVEPSLFEVRLLGHPQVRWLGGSADGNEELGQGSIVSWKLRRAFKLFSFLASGSPDGARREELIDAAWPDDSDEVIHKNFHPTLSHLRRSLERATTASIQPLQYRDGVYRLSPEVEWWIDSVELARLAEEGRRLAGSGRGEAAIRAWETAWSLYRGEFLEGYYASWVLDRRDDLMRLYLEVLRGLGDELFAFGELERSLDAYRSILAIDPLEERIHLALMRIYARWSRRDLVRHQYDRLNQLLRRELGVEPLPETADEYHRLMG